MRNFPLLDHSGLAVVGRGGAAVSDLSELQSRQRASLYADPLSWLVFDAVGQAVNELGEKILSAKNTVGHIVVSDQCTTFTMLEIGTSIPAGRFSPLRFSGANPGLICTLPSQLLGFSGPSLVLSMPPDAGLPPAMTVARAWLRERMASHVFVTYHLEDASGHRVVTTVFQQE